MIPIGYPPHGVHSPLTDQPQTRRKLDLRASNAVSMPCWNRLPANHSSLSHGEHIAAREIIDGRVVDILGDANPLADAVACENPLHRQLVRGRIPSQSQRESRATPRVTWMPTPGKLCDQNGTASTAGRRTVPCESTSESALDRVSTSMITPVTIARRCKQLRSYSGRRSFHC